MRRGPSGLSRIIPEMAVTDLKNSNSRVKKSSAAPVIVRCSTNKQTKKVHAQIYNRYTRKMATCNMATIMVGVGCDIN